MTAAPGRQVAKAIAEARQAWQRAGVDRLLRFSFWAAAAFAFVMAVLPHPPELPGTPSDKVQHILAFTTLALLGLAAYPRLAGVSLVLGLSAFGALIEVAQMIPSLNRDAEALDWLADTAAVIAVVLIVSLWRRLRGRVAAGSRDGVGGSAG